MKIKICFSAIVFETSNASAIESFSLSTMS